jgi:hypothetical protein
VVDPLTQSAIQILSRLAKTSEDRRARRALDHLRQLVLDVAPTGVALRATEPCEDPHDRGQAGDGIAEPSLEPSAREVGTLFTAIMAARRHGIVLRRTWRFTWVDVITGGDWDAELIAHNSGTARLDDDEGVVWIELRRGLSDYDLMRTVIHELKHADDMSRLGREGYYAQPEAGEARACAFENLVMSAEWRPEMV